MDGQLETLERESSFQGDGDDEDDLGVDAEQGVEGMVWLLPRLR